mmetsp:Transcript_30740/g.81705  ORF Transcript_30740/g.81705 Transcript_30740/m.81705 type:complete len:270 (-) Transcript_30740:184-993(-)
MRPLEFQVNGPHGFVTLSLEPRICTRALATIETARTVGLIAWYLISFSPRFDRQPPIEGFLLPRRQHREEVHIHLAQSVVCRQTVLVQQIDVQPRLADMGLKDEILIPLGFQCLRAHSGLPRHHLALEILPSLWPLVEAQYTIRVRSRLLIGDARVAGDDTPGLANVDLQVSVWMSLLQPRCALWPLGELLQHRMRFQVRNLANEVVHVNAKFLPEALEETSRSKLVAVSKDAQSWQPWSHQLAILFEFFVKGQELCVTLQHEPITEAV